MGRSGYETTFLWPTEDSETPYSIYSADTPAIEEDNPLFTLKDSFLQVAMAEYMQAHGRGRQQDDNVPSIDNIEISIEVVDGENETNDRPRKRGRLSDSGSTATGEKKSQRALTKRRAQDRRLWLACPYAKKDPVRYRDCYRYFLGRVRDVKQHLTRCHRKPIYCPICNETFDDEDEKDVHIRSQNCTRHPSIEIEGISERQKKELGHRLSAKLPEEEQWFAVWDTLFSPHPRPRTPYRDRELSEDLCVFQDFMTARGPTLLAEFLEARGVITSNLPHEEGDLATFNKDVLGEGLQLIIDQWTTDSATAIEQLSASHSLRSSPTVDSGIALQMSYSQTRDERRKTDKPSGSDPTNSSFGDGKNETDEDRRKPSNFNFAKDQEKRADVIRVDSGFEKHYQSVTDYSVKSSEEISMDSSQNYAEVSDPFAMSQFTDLPDYVETAVFSTAAEVPDLLGFDMGWPP
ncbi:hypothetical protein F4804DRAFT_322913 [Jackrogersella minutella]|nr:hypothetical protein F4804DRAFT_322913 [Jackrogersella minutella]